MHLNLRVGEVFNQASCVPLPGVLLVAREQGTLFPAQDCLGRDVEEVSRVTRSALGVVARHASEGTAQAAVGHYVEVHVDGTPHLTGALVVDGQVIGPRADAESLIKNFVAGGARLDTIVQMDETSEACIAFGESHLLVVASQERSANIGAIGSRGGQALAGEEVGVGLLGRRASV